MSVEINEFNSRYHLHVQEHYNYCKDDKCHFKKLLVATDQYYFSYIKLHQKVCSDIDCCTYVMLEKTLTELLQRDFTLVKK